MVPGFAHYALQEEEIAKVRSENFGKRLGTGQRGANVYKILESIKIEELPSKVPPGNKTNTTFFIRRTNFDDGPGALADDKAPYSGGYGGHVYAYEVRNEKFKRVVDKSISTTGGFTYKKGGLVYACDPNWIIQWQSYSTRSFEGSELKRHVTYYVTSNPQFLWMNDICLVEYTGIDGG